MKYKKCKPKGPRGINKIIYNKVGFDLLINKNFFALNDNKKSSS